jgi:glycosyltransferase involved in cell wall biosynthesis
MTLLHRCRQSTSAPTITVVTPVLNGERFIAACLENVLAQGCSKSEHLIVDGGSTDATEAIVRSYQRGDETIRWIQEPGANQSRAMNLGVEASRARVLGILNVDDFYEPETLNRVVELFATLPSPALVVGNCNGWRDGALEYVNRPFDLRFEKLLLGPDFYQFPFNPAGYFYDRSLHEVIGTYDVADDYSMDLDFLLRAVRQAHVVYLDETWGNIRIHPEAKTVKDRHAGDHDRRRDVLLRRYRRQLGYRQRAELYAELGSRRSYRAMLRLRERIAASIRTRLRGATGG